MTVEEVVEAYGVTVEDVRAALEFADEVTEQQRFYPFSMAG
jgi:uncharacterized protein (DUF433 family)